MISMLLLASLTLMGLSTGDDMGTAASDGVTSVEPTYTLYWPSKTPTFSLNETISFTWSATGVSNAFYACHSSVAMDAEAERREWLNSSTYPLSNYYTYGDLTACEAPPLGPILSQLNLTTGWPATCFFGMRSGTTKGGYGDKDFIVTTSSKATPSTVVRTVFVTPSSTAPPMPTVQPPTTAVQSAPTSSALPKPGDGSAISGGAIAGIVVGSVGSALVIVVLAVWRKNRRRRTSTSDALPSSFKEAPAPAQGLLPTTANASRPTSSTAERSKGMVHEMSALDPPLIFELESPRHDGPHELPEK